MSTSTDFTGSSALPTPVGAKAGSLETAGTAIADNLQYALVGLYELVAKAVLIVPDLLENFYTEVKNIFVDAKIEFSQYNVGRIQASIEKYVKEQVLKSTKVVIEAAKNKYRVKKAAKLAQRGKKGIAKDAGQKKAAEEAIARLEKEQSQILADAKAEVGRLVPDDNPLANVLISNDPKIGTSEEDVRRFRREILKLVEELLIGSETDSKRDKGDKDGVKNAFSTINSSAVKGAALIEKLKADALAIKRAQLAQLAKITGS
ncbi:MAG: hypothetical protein ACPGR8_10475 [Limisphaerales bacterium]